jgi:hypothetical protein
MNARSCRALPHSTTASQCAAYSRITESPLSRDADDSGFSQNSRPARRASSWNASAPEA